MDDTRSKTGTGPALRARRLYADRRLAESLRSRGWIVFEPNTGVTGQVFNDSVGLRHVMVHVIDRSGRMELPTWLDLAVHEVDGERRP